MAKKKEAFKQGKTLGISGREMFLFNPELVVGDDEDPDGGGVVQVVQESEQDDGEVAVDLTNFAVSAEGSAETMKSEGEASSEAGKDKASAILSSLPPSFFDRIAYHRSLPQKPASSISSGHLVL